MTEINKCDILDIARENLKIHKKNPKKFRRYKNKFYDDSDYIISSMTFGVIFKNEISITYYNEKISEYCGFSLKLYVHEFNLPKKKYIWKIF